MIAVVTAFKLLWRHDEITVEIHVIFIDPPEMGHAVGVDCMYENTFEFRWVVFIHRPDLNTAATIALDAMQAGGQDESRPCSGPQMAISIHNSSFSGP